MPRDDLSIDFVKGNMPQMEALDPAIILDDWTNRVSNLPEEIKFIQDEITDKDRQVAECLKIIDERENRILKWIKANGSQTPNPREDAYRQTVRESFAKAEQLSREKIELIQKLQNNMDRHIRQLDKHIKTLYDRNEPGFTDPDEVPSLLRPSAANTSAPSARSVNPSVNAVTVALSPLANPVNPLGPRGTNSQIRSVQTAQQVSSSSAPTSPAASMITKRGARETSAGPGSGSLQRGPRANTGLPNASSTSSGLARHSSLGPGTPKGHTATGVPRAGSAGPRTVFKGAPGRKGTPSGSGVNRISKKGTPAAGNKSGLQRVRKTAKNSPSSTAESELSDADSVASGDESDGRAAGAGAAGRSTPAGVSLKEGREATGGAPRTKREEVDEDGHAYADDDEASDDKKYCLCQKVSFGDMIACDNVKCPYEWFHWSCVGLKSEPQPGGTWYCPVCTAAMKKK